MKTELRAFRLIVSCPDRIGIVAKISAILADCGASITEADQYCDVDSRTFFMRCQFEVPGSEGIRATLENHFRPLAQRFSMVWRINDVGYRQRVVVMASKFDHCLAYLLHRRKVGDLPFDIPCVISNHEDLRELVEWYGIPYKHVPVPASESGKEAAFENIAGLISDACPDTIVLARYMQIFPPWLCQRYLHRVINIHHSFLPSFVGARPYHQAKTRGVKLIGATCHYVTEDLDAGPIIEQDVVRIRHSDTIEDMMRLGKDIENVVLARGLRFHLEDRILVHGNKTILFA